MARIRRRIREAWNDLFENCSVVFVESFLREWKR